MGFTLEEYERIKDNLRTARERSTSQPSSKPRKRGKPKYKRSLPEDRTSHGVVYASIGEKKFAEGLYLELAGRGGVGMWWVRQPVFDLAGVQYRPDFLVVRVVRTYPQPGQIRFYAEVYVYEIKPKLREPFRSEALRTFHRNAAQVKELWGVEVELVEIE